MSIRMPGKYYEKLDLKQGLIQPKVKPETVLQEPAAPTVVAPDALPVTASADDIIERNMRSNVIFRNPNLDVQPGVYVLPEGRVTVHDRNGHIGIQVKGDKVTNFDKLLKRIQNLTPSDNLTNNPSGVNGEIDEPVSQGGTGDCWLITGILAFTATEEGKKLLKDSMEIKDNGDVVINFKGLGISITVTAEEIAKHDTDNIKEDPFSNGDNDMLVFELAMEKLIEQYPELIDILGIDEKGFHDVDGYIGQGGMAQNLFLLLASEDVPVGSNFANDIISEDLLKQYDVTMVVVPDTVKGYGGTSMPLPNDMTEDEMYNADKTNFSEKYIDWYNENGVKLYRDSLVKGLSENDTLSLLQQLYENQPCAVTFGLYLYAGETVKSAQCTDGSTYTFTYNKGAKQGQYCGHAFSIVGMTQDTVTFVNPWDSSAKITMTWEEFAKLGIGGFEYCVLPKSEETGNENGNNGVENTDGNDDTDGVEGPDEPEQLDTPKGDFNTFSGLQEFLHQSEAVKYVEEALNFKMPAGPEYADFMQLATDVGNKHKDDFATVTKAQVLEEFKLACEEYLKTKGGGDKPADKTGDFADYDALKKYLSSSELRGYIQGDGKITDFSLGFTYEDIANTVAKAHEKDFASVTKEQLKQEFIAEYNRRADEVKPPADNPAKGDFSTINELRNYVFSGARSDFEAKYPDVKFPGAGKIADDVSKKHTEDYATVTKEQLLEELYAYVTGNTPPADDNDEVTFKKEELAGFDEDAIEKYFIANSDGTYRLDETSISQDFPEKDYGKIETPAQLKDAIAKKADANKAGSTDGTNGTSGDNKTYPSGFKNWDECWQSIQNGDIYATVSDTVKALIGDADIKTVMDKYYKTACDQLKSQLQNGFATDTKDEIVADLTNEVLKLKKADDDAAAATAAKNNGIKDLQYAINDIKRFIVSDCLTKYKKDFINIGYSFSTNGSINLSDETTQNMFNNIVQQLIASLNLNSPGALEKLGGEAKLKKIVQSAWVDACKDIANNSTQDAATFIDKVMANLDSILKKAANNPEYLDYYTNSCYGDTSLKNWVPNLSKDVNSNNPKQYDTGEMHLDDDNSDKLFQATMNKVLENIYNKYPNIDKDYLKKLFNKAQENALSYKDMPTGTDRGKMGDLVNLVLYHFDKLFKADAKNTMFAARTEDTQPRAATSAQNDTKNETIKSIIPDIMRGVKDIKRFIVSDCITKTKQEKIHTEFGMDKNGNIMFQEESTTTVYNTIFEQLKSSLNLFSPGVIDKLGGEAVLKQLLQVAWITTYNSFNSSQSNDTTAFINKVMENLEKILGKLQTNPELMEVFTTRGSYADTSFISGLTHYNTNTTSGNDEVIIYNGATIYADGSVHISNTTDDNDYQTTMNDLLQRLIKKYPSLEADTITSVFQSAQYKALQALQGNVYDCPYGTGNNGGRVEDTSKDWGGKDNRKGDSKKGNFRIDMDQLVQMTLYYFDKLIYAELLK